MAQQIAFTAAQVPGSLAVTGVSADTAAMVSCADGRCPRCERGRADVACPGIAGEPTHLGS